MGRLGSDASYTQHRALTCKQAMLLVGKAQVSAVLVQGTVLPANDAGDVLPQSTLQFPPHPFL